MIVGVLLVVIVGMIAMAFDTGWLAVTRVQLHAGADSAALAGGTELLPGLGFMATATPEEVRSAATDAAVEFAGRNPNGDRSVASGGCYCDSARDIKMGKAVYDPAAGVWVKTPDATPYNYVQVDLHRDQGGSAAGDGRLPMFFSRIFAIPEADSSAYATAVILPANGFYIEEGSDDTAGLMPFAFYDEMWRKMERAQDYYDSNPGVLQDPNILSLDDSETGTVLFGATNGKTGQDVQLFFDNYTVTDGVVTAGVPDGQLEVNIYPKKDVTFDGVGDKGNFGTVDFGSTDNSTAVLKRQIEFGLNADDLSYYENNTITISETDPLDAEGDTGISAGIEAALVSIVGDCRVIALFGGTNGGSGNNNVYTLTEFVGATVVAVKLSGNEQAKHLFVQRCKYVDNNAIGDTDQEINENTTVFTPLILIE